MAATGPALAGRRPGIPRLPGPGQFYASPALAALLRSIPAAPTRRPLPRTPGRHDRRAALPAPDSLIIVVGRTAARAVAGSPGACRSAAISTTTPSSCNGACYSIGIDANGIDLVLAVVAAALLFPVLIFIGTATRLSAARREQRFAAMRLVGATPRQIAVDRRRSSRRVAAVARRRRSASALFFAAPSGARDDPVHRRAVLHRRPVAEPARRRCVVALGVPVAAAVAAGSRCGGSDLAARRHPPGHARGRRGAWRLIPLFAGLARAGLLRRRRAPATTPGQIQAST